MRSGFAVLVVIMSLLAKNASAQSNSIAAVSSGTDAAAPINNAGWNTTMLEIQRLLRSQAEQLQKQSKILELQQTEIEELKRQISLGRRAPDSDAAQEQVAAANAASLSLASLPLRAKSPEQISDIVPPAPQFRAASVAQSAAAQEPDDQPLSIRFGHGRLTPGGWVDLTGYYRSTDVGSGLGTAFASIPFNNTVQGGLSEARLTAQSSRISVRADQNFGATRIFGYAEADFNGYLPSNAYVSTNSDSLRLRVYFTNISRGRWEFLGGQSWSLLTPNRVGVSPFLSEIYNTMHLDTNYQVGLTYARQAQLRVVYHLGDQLAVALSAENPQQFSGSAVTFPALFSPSETDLGSISAAGGGTSTPTLHPDLIAKLSLDRNRLHTEIAGLLAPVAIFTPASITGTTRATDIREGGGISAAANVAAAKTLHLILTGFWSDGGGRYIGGLGPAFVVEQPSAKTAPFRAELIHSGSGIAAAEWQASRATLLSLTFSGAWFARSYSVDPSSGAPVGYGFAGSATSNNRALGEATFASQTTLWKQPGFGAVQVITQFSRVKRTPWYVAPGNPKNAQVFEGYANLRYVLP